MFADTNAINPKADTYSTLAVMRLSTYDKFVGTHEFFARVRAAAKTTAHSLLKTHSKSYWYRAGVSIF
jgi:hypothetical protein